MKNLRAVRAVIGTGFLLLCCFLTGCSASFCGFRVGNQEALVFTCAEDFPEPEKEAAKTEATETQAAKTETAKTETQITETKTEAAKTVSELETEIPVLASGESGSADGKIDLNTAGLEELMTLNGVGETRAKAIVEYRSQNGAFTKIEDIMQIPGIKEGIFSKIKDQITVH